jgi:hypothetical protein
MPSEVTLEARRYASATDLTFRGVMNMYLSLFGLPQSIG